MTTPSSEKHDCAPIIVRIMDIRSSFASDAEAEAAARLINAHATVGATSFSWDDGIRLDVLQTAITDDRKAIDGWVSGYADWKKRSEARERWLRWNIWTLGLSDRWMNEPSRTIEPSRPVLRLALAENHPDAISVMKAYVALEERGYVIINRERTDGHTVIATKKLTDVLKTTVPLGLLIDTKADLAFITPENLAIAA